MTATLPVSEVFGPVFQGEGPHAGRLCAFLRLGLCNLTCSWCDTPYTWDHTRFDIHQQCPPQTAAQILDRIPDVPLLVLSGGEPMIHRDNPALRAVLNAWLGDVHVETNGTLWPSLWLLSRVNHWSVSPKLAHGGDPANRRLHPEVLRDFAYLPNVVFKVVCQTVSDLDDVDLLVRTTGVLDSQVWIMPEGTTPTQVIDTAYLLADKVAERGWNLTLRQHTLLYGTERAR